MGWWILFAGLVGFVCGFVVGALVIAYREVKYQHDLERHVGQQTKRMRDE